jgi:hypothetical protein
VFIALTHQKKKYGLEDKVKLSHLHEVQYIMLTTYFVTISVSKIGGHRKDGKNI